tara:strand:+ start:1368753 stop:1372112 length:3360 start_codon:yes stop_codon:yes gene_type:complete
MSIIGCTTEKEKSVTLENQSASFQLFEVLSPETTGLTFNNLINESPAVNGVLYEYLYNGGGVAAGDFNNDGWQDLFFTSNLNQDEIYLNKGSFQFQRVTAQAKLRGNKGFSTGVTTVDINNDGLLDIYVCKSGNYDDTELLKNELFINLGINSDGVPTFEERASDYGLDISDHSTQAAFFDYDRDGDLDMFLLNHGIDPAETEPNIDRLLLQKSKHSNNKLFKNNAGHFTDVSAASGIINNSIGYGLGIAVGDLNNDHWPDMVVGMDYSEKDHLYINQKNGTFKEVIRQATNHISNFSMGNDIGDINNDGRFDFISVDMVSNNNYDLKTNMSGMNPQRFFDLVDRGLHHQYMFNTLQLNNGTMLDDGTVPAFSDVAQITGLAKTNWSWAPLFFDMNNDGLQDLFVSNGVLRSFRNNDFVIYKRKRVQQLYADMNRLANRDSLIEQYYKDLLAVMPEKKEVNLFYTNNGSLSFSEIKNDSLAPTATNGAIYVDLDNDGDVDLVGNNINDPALIYRNNSNENSTNHFLKVKLRGPKGNANGIGAKVWVATKGLRQVKELYISRGFQSAVPHELHFGLGIHQLVDQLKITWPDGRSQILNEVEADQKIIVNYEDSSETRDESEEIEPLFATSNLRGVGFEHQENSYDDFKKEILLPHKYSQNGPALAVADVNGDQLDDFFVGGANNQAAALYLQKEDGSFIQVSKKVWASDAIHEDVAATFFDADQDGDLDLYVASGGNELPEGDTYYEHRMYINNGKGQFEKAVKALPNIQVSASCVVPADIDGDGDLDLFVGGKTVPGRYPFAPDSYLLINQSTKENVIFKNATETNAPILKGLGMVSSAQWGDIDQDGDLDLVVVGEWMPLTILENVDGQLTNSTKKASLDRQTGWWYGLKMHDFDSDGDLDFIAGNLGKNYKYQASPEEPFEVYAKDFDENGSLDIVLSYYEKGKLYPLRGRQCSSDQMPFIKKKFPSYNEFGAADLSMVYGKEALENALHKQAETFASVYVENLGDFKFKIHELDPLVQLSSVNSILVDDFNKDGNADALLAGNLYQAEVETTRNDASYGTVLLGNGKGKFTAMMPAESGLFVKGDVKQASILRSSSGEKRFLFAKNDAPIQAVDLN